MESSEKNDTIRESLFSVSDWESWEHHLTQHQHANETNVSHWVMEEYIKNAKRKWGRQPHD